MGKPIIREGDPTSHGGTVLEAFPTLTVFGKRAAGIGHQGFCPKCKTTFTIVAGAKNYTFMGKNVAVEGMQTSCGAVLIATQGQATVGDEPGTHSVQSALDGVPTAALAAGGGVDEEVIEHWYSLEDEAGNPVDGYRYDLYQGEDRLAHKASFAGGKSTVIPGGESEYVMWLERDSAIREAVSS